MSEIKIVTPDMIDDELVNTIATTPRMADLPFSRKQSYDYIRHTLAYLANNPRVPSDSDLREVMERIDFPGQDWTDPQVFQFCAEWQSRAYLKKEKELPAEVLELVRQQFTPGTTEHRLALKLAAAVHHLGLANGAKK